MQPVKLGLLGVGTVGASTALVLKNNAAEIARRAGRSIEIIQASRRSLAAGMPEGSGNISLTTDPFEVVDNPEIDIAIELIGGYEPARELVLRAIENGKHVVIMNAELDGTVGPILKVYADKAGVVITNADGDQPGVVIAPRQQLKSRSLGRLVFQPAGRNDGVGQTAPFEVLLAPGLPVANVAELDHLTALSIGSGSGGGHEDEVPDPMGSGRLNQVVHAAIVYELGAHGAFPLAGAQRANDVVHVAHSRVDRRRITNIDFQPGPVRAVPLAGAGAIAGKGSQRITRLT